MTKSRIIAVVSLFLVLITGVFYGVKLQDTEILYKPEVVEIIEDNQDTIDVVNQEQPEEVQKPKEEILEKVPDETVKETLKTDKEEPKQEETKKEEPKKEPEQIKNPIVTISISCKTILDNLDLLSSEKSDLVPDDGYILKPTEVEIKQGESVFDVLSRVCKEQKIHMEFENTPIYNSAYIEGIHNLYEFDVGSLSGWMYKVNGKFPNYGCSLYALNDSDVIEWVYTCDLGEDVGGNVRES